MLEIGDIIVYGFEGVCKVADLQEISFSGVDDKKEYYILVPDSNASCKLYLPKDNSVLMARVKSLLTYEEIKDLISDESNSIEWIEDSKARNKYYKELISTYDRKNIFAVAKQLYFVKNGKLATQANFTSWMDETLKKAASILYSEFLYVVDLTEDELLPFIAGEIECNKK
jgi:CarD family transcriptional regulator